MEAERGDGSEKMLLIFICKPDDQKKILQLLQSALASTELNDSLRHKFWARDLVIAICHGELDKESAGRIVGRIGMSAIHSGLIIDVTRSPISPSPRSRPEPCRWRQCELGFGQFVNQETWSHYKKADTCRWTQRVDILGDILRYPAFHPHI